MSISDVRDSQRNPANKPRRYAISAGRMQAQLDRRREAEGILETVAEFNGLTAEQLRAGRGCARNSALKFEAAWLMRKCCISWPIIGKVLGYSSHQPAIHGVRRYQEIRARLASAVTDIGTGPRGQLAHAYDLFAARAVEGGSP